MSKFGQNLQTDRIKKTCQYVGEYVKNQEQTGDVFYERFLNVIINK